MILMSQPTTLLELIGLPPAHSTAIVLPEAGIRAAYQQLRDQVSEMADGSRPSESRVDGWRGHPGHPPTKAS